MKRLILFDVDGTLVRGGPAREAFRVALEASFGTAGAIDEHDFSGKTDPQIARELLLEAGHTPAQIEQGSSLLWKRYLEELGVRLETTPMQAIAGVVALLTALEEGGQTALGLVTGNLARGARLKLDSAGLGGRFHVGGFGSDHPMRNHLPPIAIARARARWGMAFTHPDVWIVGDTPLDVACGHHEGVRTLAVATGRHGTEELGGLRSGCGRGGPARSGRCSANVVRVAPPVAGVLLALPERKIPGEMPG